MIDERRRCGMCGGALNHIEIQENDSNHANKWDCIYTLKHTLNVHMKNTECLEDIIEKLISTLQEIVNKGDSYSSDLAKSVLENL
jgi:hypothetical protein